MWNQQGWEVVTPVVPQSLGLLGSALPYRRVQQKRSSVSKGHSLVGSISTWVVGLDDLKGLFLL